ncbi:MAG: S-ribosylhomocysteine lyase [Lachnospiraceae bacterium]|nr:S-ribosylhomocysteine lyase [Lachnospiraceae bacterium]
MKNSVSFNVDHLKLTRGIYLSKIDTLGDVQTITLDIRLRKPYKEEIITNKALHSFEHCFATAVRDVSDGYENAMISYFGPMGCQTGFYLVVNFKDYTQDKYFPLFAKLLKESLVYLRGMKEIPANNEKQCGFCYSLGEMADAIAVAEDMENLVDEMTRQGGFHTYVYL